MKRGVRLVSAVLVAVVGCSTQAADSRDATVPTTAPGERGRVTKHTDGDTLRIDGIRVRLIGVDTPEVSGPAECYGTEAAARTAALLPLGAEVLLRYDVGRSDRYGRVLAYVYRAHDGLFVNAELVRGGYASALTVPPNVEHADEFVRLQRQARAARRGLWSLCAAERPTAATR